MKEVKVSVITYNNCHGSGYWNGGVWDEGVRLETVIKSGTFDEWLQEHNEERVGSQLGNDGLEMFQNCEDSEEAIKYGMEKLGLDHDAADSLWEDVMSATEGEEEFDVDTFTVKL